MTIRFIFTAFIFYCFDTLGQGPIVPEHLRFADINLKINEAARRQIQEDVDALTNSPKYFYAKVDEARLYFPIIERVLKEEGISEDFKYLVIQESALVANLAGSHVK